MRQFDFSDNSIVNYIPISPTSPKMMFIPTEESASWILKDFVNSQTNYEGISQTPYSLLSANRTNLSPLFPGFKSPTQYVGVSTIDTIHIINPIFADFFISNENIESENLFLNDEEKIKVLGNKIQLLEIPQYRFKNYNDNTYNYGLYYLSIQSKCITTTVSTISLGKHLPYEATSGSLSVSTAYVNSTNTSLKRRTYYSVDKNPFLNTIWEFENINHLQQKGRLLGSVVEVYSSSGEYKTTKFISNDDINTNALVNLELSPNYIGYDSPFQNIIVGDILKIYPKESYFNAISIILNFQSINNSITGLSQYIKNDVARDLQTNVFEIYDDNGITVSEDGSIDGTIIASYQISQVNNKEVRKNLNIE